MKLNGKLTALLAGRALNTVEELNTTVTMSWRDGSRLKVMAQSEVPITVPTGAALMQIYEDGPGFELWFDRGEKVVLHLVNPGGSVSLRNPEGEVIYLG
ncbi:MAG TPA: hypothetical protein VGD78_14495 [Chthoniobacterales bacterium]